MKREAGIVGRTFHDLRGTAATMFAMAGATVIEIATMTGHSVTDVQNILDRNYIHRNERLGDAGVDKVDAMLSAMAAVANDLVIGGERESHQPNGVIGTKRRARAPGVTCRNRWHRRDFAGIRWDLAGLPGASKGLRGSAALRRRHTRQDPMAPLSE